MAAARVQGSAVEQRPDGLVYDGATLADDSVVLNLDPTTDSVHWAFWRCRIRRCTIISSAGNYGLLDQIAALQWVRDASRLRRSILPRSPSSANRPEPCRPRLLSSRGTWIVSARDHAKWWLPTVAAGTGQHRAGQNAFAEGDRVIGLAGCAGVNDRKGHCITQARLGALI